LLLISHDLPFRLAILGSFDPKFAKYWHSNLEFDATTKR